MNALIESGQMAHLIAHDRGDNASVDLRNERLVIATS